jgi:hypothetical protein
MEGVTLVEAELDSVLGTGLRFDVMGFRPEKELGEGGRSGRGRARAPLLAGGLDGLARRSEGRACDETARSVSSPTR